MKTRKLFVLITAIALMASLSLHTFADEWNLAQQGALNITKDGDYTIISTDKTGKQASTDNAIIIADNIKATITLDNVTIDNQKTHGMQLGVGSSITLNLIGHNTILNDTDNSGIQNMGGNLIITSNSGGTLKLQKDQPPITDNTITFNIKDLPTMLDSKGNQFVIVMNDNQDGFVLTESDGTLPTEVIVDEAVPLTDAPIPTTLSIEGNAQVETGQDIYRHHNSYVIGMDTRINGTHGWDIEGLANAIPYLKDYSNLVLMVDGHPLEHCRILTSGSKKTSVIVSDADNKIKLTESKLKDKSLTEGVDTNAILRSCHLHLGKDYNSPFVVRFHLDQELAGKTVEVRSTVNGQLVTETVTISESGIAAIAASGSGDFAVIEK